MSAILLRISTIAVLLTVFAVLVQGQVTSPIRVLPIPGQLPSAAQPFQDPGQRAATPTLSRSKAAPSEHRFSDRDNAWLFSAVAASRTLDYFSTLNMRRRGRQEILLTNDIVDNHAAFAAIEAGGTTVSLGASYLFHRHHHHRLEHWTSIIHASLTTSGAIRNYCLKTEHRSTGP